MKVLFYKATYRMMGLVLVFSCLGTFSLMFGLFPDLAQAVGSHENHMVQEFGCALAFIGLIAFWHSCHLERGKAIHLILTVFLLLLTLVHWIDYFKGRSPIASPLINTLPTLGFLVMYHFYDFVPEDP